MKERIQKVLAAAGYGSRRACEDLVRDGLVTIDGEVVDTLPYLVDPSEVEIRVDGSRMRKQRLVYYLLNKPKGVLCTNSDPAGRVRAIDLLKGVRQRVYPVGRLDASSTGLLLLTNDGDLADRLTHPRYGVEKTYQASVAGRISLNDIEKLRKGIWLAEGKTQPAVVRLLKRGRQKSLVEIKLHEGRNRQIRRMLASLGHKVFTLKRTRIGHLRLAGLGPGNFRALTSTELDKLNKLITRSSTNSAPRTQNKSQSRAKRTTRVQSAPRSASKKKRTTKKTAQTKTTAKTGRKKRGRRTS